MNQMRTSLILAVIGLTIITAAQEATASGLFTANETSLDIFGYDASRDKGGADTTAWGPGVGVNHFFSEWLGVGADTYADAFTLPYLLNASAILRYPIGETHFAVYGFGGGGRQWTHAPQWMAHVGGGGEYRFNSKTGFFADIRGVFPQNTRDYTVFRFGFRLKFQ